MRNLLRASILCLGVAFKLTSLLACPCRAASPTAHPGRIFSNRFELFYKLSV